MKYKILLDMDGVIADFVWGIAAFHNRAHPYENPDEHRWDLENIWGITSAQLWRSVDHCFWDSLEKTEEADTLVKYLGEAFGVPNIRVLTSPPKTGAGQAVHGKISWMRWHFSHLSDKMIFTEHKEWCASPDKVLIDDNEKNVEKFREAGGNAVLVPRPWNSRFETDPTVIFRELGKYAARTNS